MSKVVCPRCGAEVVLPEKSEVVIGRTISEEGNNTYVLNIKDKESKKVNNAEQRKATLEQNGISTEGYFSLKLPSGKTVYLNENGDKVDISIVGDNIGNAKLYRRWVMAQWFRQNNNPRGYADTVSHLSYDYQWKVISNELKTLAKLQTSDPEYFEERKHFFDISSITGILKEYEQDLRNKVKHMKTKNCKGVPYYHIAGRDFFDCDIEKKVFIPLDNSIERFFRSVSYSDASKRFESIKRNFLKVYKPDKKYVTTSFKDCYKGAGAYYTLQNMVLYHGCTLGEYKEVNCCRWEKFAEHKGMDAYKYMKSLLDNPYYIREGWRWVGILRQCIEDNNFSFGK